MPTGERIHYFRILQGLTLKNLGIAAGLPEKTADIRISQYENGIRTPKESMLNQLAHSLKVSPHALNVPDIDSPDGLIHTLFALEDLYGLTIGEFEGRTCLYLNRDAPSWLRNALIAWKKHAQLYHNDEITSEEYNAWRYNYTDHSYNSIHASNFSNKESAINTTNIHFELLINQFIDSIRSFSEKQDKSNKL